MELDLPTTIVEITVYPEQALITRRGSLAIPEPGAHALRIGGLPQSVQRDSLRAAGRGPTGTRILGVEQSAEYHPTAPEETLRRLRDELDRLGREIELRQERERLLEEQRGWLRALGEQTARRIANGIAAGTAKPADAEGVFAYTAQESERLAAARQVAQREREDLQRQLVALQREYQELGGHIVPDRLTALVRVEVPTAAEITVELSYLVAGASWRPRYDARVDTSSARVRLSQQALVTQRTGEDWPAVALALSTARPHAARTLPEEPDPWYVDVRRPPMMKPQAAMPMMARAAVMPAPAPPGAAFSAADATNPGLAAVAVEEMSAALTDVERSGAAQIFRVPGSTSVPSDGQPHTLGLADDDLPCRLEYAAMPSVAPGAHLRAVTPNLTGRVLLPGSIHVFHAGSAGDEYVGATQLDLTAPEAELTLYLGVDDNVTVKHELIERDTDKASILQGGVRRVTCGYRVTLGNRTGSPQRVVLMDRLPVPRHERVKLRVLDIRPQPTSRTKLEQLTWDLTLAPNEERRVEWRFVVESPTDLDLTGLP